MVGKAAVAVAAAAVACILPSLLLVAAVFAAGAVGLVECN